MENQTTEQTVQVKVPGYLIALIILSAIVSLASITLVIFMLTSSDVVEDDVHESDTMEVTESDEDTDEMEDDEPTDVEPPFQYRGNITISDGLNPDELADLESQVSLTGEGTRYTDNIFRYSVVIPESWGDLLETRERIAIEGIQAIITLTPVDDIRRFIKFTIVLDVDVDLPTITDRPHTEITSALGRTYFYSGGGDYAGYPGQEGQVYYDIADEVNEIVDSFKTF